MEYSKYFESYAFQHRSSTLDGGTWTELMTDKWFGSNDPLTGRILDSRWKDTKIPYMDSDFYDKEMIDLTSTFFPEEEEDWLAVYPPHLSSPYGLLRSPWNYNPSPYLTRYNNINGIQFEGVATAAKIFYMGSDCAEYEQFMEKYARGQTFETYLTESEDNIHGKVHFTIGGAGGEKAQSVDDLLRNKYQFTDEDLLYIARGSQALYKSYIPRYWVSTNPLSCTSNPWQSGKLMTYATPMDGDGPSCTCSEQYMVSETKLSELISLYQIKNANFLYNLEYVDRKDAMNLVCSRMAYDGDMASSGAANDPMFWVAHGAIERLFQRVIFSGILADKVYSNPKRNQCSGHNTDSTKKWLSGFYLEDESIDVSALTNAELAEILDPTTDHYRDLINFVYEDSTWDWCDGSESWFSA
jgi:hypothetical protein